MVEKKPSVALHNLLTTKDAEFGLNLSKVLEHSVGLA